MSKVEKKASSFGSRYDKSRLFIGSYGDVFYIPKVDLLSQLSLDPHSLLQSVMSKKDSDSPETLNLQEYKIKVPVPPHPSAAMINPLTKERFPLGTTIDPGTGDSLDSIESVLEDRGIKNQIIYSDVDRGTIYFVKKSGALGTKKVGQVSPIIENPNEILQLLERKIQVKTSFRVGQTGLRHKWDKSAATEDLFYVDPKDSSPRAKAHRTRLQSMSGVDFEEKGGGVPLFMYAKNRDFKLFVESELLSLEDKIRKGTASVLSQQLSVRYAQMIVAVLFAEKHSELYANLIEQEEGASAVSAADAPDIPHVNKDTRFLPHQAYALSFMKDKKVAMVDADPGAGKTLIMLSDILEKLSRGLVKRPCIVMPNSLLSQQKREMEEWTQGTVNFVVINTETARQMDPSSVSSRSGVPRKGKGDQDTGLKEIKKLVQEAPPNTILLTSYHWLGGRPQDQRVTGSGVHYKRPSWLITWAGVDMLVLDESHNIRIGSSGDQSQKSEAIMQMARMVNYKRCYTGTVAPNGPDDIFLQMSFLDPSVLGDRETFRAKYGRSAEETTKRRSKRIEEFKPGAIKEIRSKVNRRVGVSIRRSAWLNQLPQLDVNYHKATLTLPQKHVYERIMDRILREELGDDDAGTAGLQLQKEMREEYASNPAARSQVGSWQPSSLVTSTEYDAESDSLVQTEYDLENPEIEGDIKSAKGRAKAGWERYQYIDDAVGENDFLPLLQKFVALDKFLNNPPSDEFGQHFLFHEEDRVSPKVKVIDRLLAEHFSNPSNGKVIIFTHYKEVAAHILEHIQMSSSAIYYDASHTKNLDSFKKDDSVRILVAVEQSIREGQNLQMANRIIRVDLPWNPGAYEQAIARAYRLPPRDRAAQRYSVVHVDLILTDSTAEVTKFMRMVSKMHKVRQLVSGFVPTVEFPLVGMNLRNMQEVNTFEHMVPHQEAYERMRDQEIEEAKTAPDLFGTESYTVATGESMEGSDQFATPFVDSDADMNPWIIDTARYKSILLRPLMLYFNGSFWMSITMSPGMSLVLRSFEVKHKPQFLYKAFNSAREGFDIIKSLQTNQDIPLHVVNANELVPTIMGRAPVDPSVPASKIDYSGLMKQAAAPPTDFRPTNSKFSDDILAYQPSQEEFRLSANLLTLAATGKKITPLHSFSAAKIFGYFDLTPKDVDPAWLWKNSRYFALLRRNKDILQQQLANYSPQQAQHPPADVPGNEVTNEPQDNSIPGIDTAITGEGIPVQLNVSLLGNIGANSVRQIPCFTISDTSSFTAPGFSDKVVSVLNAHGFKAWQDAQQWVYLGSTRTEAASTIKKISNRLYLYKYYLSDPDHFAAQIANFGLNLSSLWPQPNKQAAVLTKTARLLEEYPEYRSVTNLVYSDD